jgi:hypothetical protein
VADPMLVPQAIASALSVREQPGESLIATLLRALTGATACSATRSARCFGAWLCLRRVSAWTQPRLSAWAETSPGAGRST